MRILFIHEVSYLEKVVFEMHEFPEHLASFGHDVTFLDFPENESLRPYRWTRRHRVIDGRAVTQAKVNLVSLPRRLPRPFDRLLTATTCLWQVGSIIDQVRPDAIVLYAVPTNGWQAVRAARKRDIPIVYRAIDSTPVIRKSVFTPLIALAEKYVLRNVDLVLFNNRVLKEYGEERGADPTRTEVLFPGVAEDVDTSERPPTAQDNCNVVFMGSLFRFAGLDWVLEGIAHSSDLRKRIRLKIIGDGEDRERLEQLVDKCDLRGVVSFTGFIRFDQLYDSMAGCQVAILPFDDAQVAQVALPGKVLQYVMAGLPTVSVHLAGLESLLQGGEGVVYSERGEPFLTAVATLLDDESIRKAVVARGIVKLREVCAWPDQARRLEEHLIQLTSKQK